MLPMLENTAAQRARSGHHRTKKDPGLGRGFEVVFSVVKKST
jgi:hypothetical protein